VIDVNGWLELGSRDKVIATINKPTFWAHPVNIAIFLWHIGTSLDHYFAPVCTAATCFATGPSPDSFLMKPAVKTRTDRTCRRDKVLAHHVRAETSHQTAIKRRH